jgi:hypothetical protein
VGAPQHVEVAVCQEQATRFHGAIRLLRAPWSPDAG